jgi:hypothetical protein
MRANYGADGAVLEPYMSSLLPHSTHPMSSVLQSCSGVVNKYARGCLGRFVVMLHTVQYNTEHAAAAELDSVYITMSGPVHTVDAVPCRGCALGAVQYMLEAMGCAVAGSASPITGWIADASSITYGAHLYAIPSMNITEH